MNELLILQRRPRCRRSLDKQPSFTRPHLVIELAQEAQTEQPVEAEALGQVVGVEAKVVEDEAKARKSRDAYQVAGFFRHGRAHHCPGFALVRAVAELVEDVRRNHCLRRARIERKA